MKTNIRNITAALLTVVVLSFGQNALAGATAEQTVTYEVSAINELSVSGATASVTVNSATAGSAPNVATDSTTSYAITTNETNRKITGSINTAMPAGVTLSATLVAPTGGSSAGKQVIATLPAATDLVTGIATLNESGKGITYELAATSAAGVVASATKTVTLTITAGS